MQTFSFPKVSFVWTRQSFSARAWIWSALGAKHRLKNKLFLIDGLVGIWVISVLVGGLPAGVNFRLARLEACCSVFKYVQTNLVI